MSTADAFAAGRRWQSRAPERASTAFDLIRHNRVMAEHQKVGFKANNHYPYMVGELHLDDFPVTNNKTAFRLDTIE